MKDDMSEYLYKNFKKEKELKQIVERIVRRFGAAVYLNQFAEDNDARYLAKQLAFAGGQQDLKELWNIARRHIPLYLDVHGEPLV